MALNISALRWVLQFFGPYSHHYIEHVAQIDEKYSQILEKRNLIYIDVCPAYLHGYTVEGAYPLHMMMIVYVTQRSRSVTGLVDVESIHGVNFVDRTTISIGLQLQLPGSLESGQKGIL